MKREDIALAVFTVIALSIAMMVGITTQAQPQTSHFEVLAESRKIDGFQLREYRDGPICVYVAFRIDEQGVPKDGTPMLTAVRCE